MTKTINLWIAVLITCLLSFNITVFTGCNSVDEEYTIRLDSLDAALDANEKALEIDFKTIGIREKLIAEHFRLVRNYCTDTMTLEFGNSLTKYKGILKTYRNFISQYPKVYDELKALQKQSNDLRTDTEKGKLSKEDFKSYYAKEMSDAKANLEFSRKLAASIHSLEPEYQRISRMVADALTEQSERNPKLKSILEAAAKSDSTN